MRVGDHYSNESLGPKDWWLNAVPNIGVPPSNNYNFTIGSFTMPYTGSIAADMHALVVWSGSNQYCRCWLSASSPGPSAFSTHGVWAPSGGIYWGGNGCYYMIPMTARWDYVAKGTNVVIVGTVGAGPGAPAITAYVLGGFIHTWVP
jgi:hypothetical protein